MSRRDEPGSGPSATAQRHDPGRVLGYDRWACDIPCGRFVESVERGGFRVFRLRIDYPPSGIPSIEAWVEKAA